MCDDRQKNDYQEAVSNLANMAGRAGTSGMAMGASNRRPTTLEEAEKSRIHHLEEAQRHSAAAEFFKSNPAFGEFIDLVRKGVIRI